MKYSKIILFGLLVITLLIPFASIAHAAKTPGYVGIKEGQTYTWTTEFDQGPLEDYYEDRGKTKEEAEEDAWDDMEDFEWEEEVVEWKLSIHEIRDEDEIFIEGYPFITLSDDYDFVKYVYSLKELDGDVWYWRPIDTYQTAKIFEPDEELWGKTQTSFRYGISIVNTPRSDLSYPAMMVAKNLDWDEVARWMEKPYTPAQKEYREANEIKIQYFLGKKQVGIYTEWDPSLYYPQYEKDLGTFESISKYNDDGILYYYEYTYDGDIIAKLELKGYQGNYVYIFENWWWMVLVAGAAVVGVIILIVVIIKLKKRK
ncbi:MAG: hypothetical protein EU529_11555 [Promethearchaeota archaeon]|nr:MAG: hypothetical protein EU529_11555 [Candidatus Lokiarchaeota archaeon]